MRRWQAVVIVACLLCPPSAASAATVDLDLSYDEAGLPHGSPTFVAAPGERNRLKVSRGRGGIVFTDGWNPVQARGDCRRVNPHRARCPDTEDLPYASLRDGDDFARTTVQFAVVTGGRGDDILRGSDQLDDLRGGQGNDKIMGRNGDDTLTGGRGRDRLHGGSGDDNLVDGESDAHAVRDVFDGGKSGDRPLFAGDTVDYGRRKTAVHVDLGQGTTSTEDRLLEVESVIGGRGDDRLTGDGAPNLLNGGPGNDLVRGGEGDDIPQGGTGDDRVFGDGGDDVVWGHAGRDSLFGGAGNDFVITAEEDGALNADELDCGDGSDDARSDSSDTLVAGCEVVIAVGLRVLVPPAVDGDSVDFLVSCAGGIPLVGCRGMITVRGLDGVTFGSTHFGVPDAVENAQISIPLTDAGAVALKSGTTVQVDVQSESPVVEPAGGYRAFMRAQ